MLSPITPLPIPPALYRQDRIETRESSSNTVSPVSILLKSMLTEETVQTPAPLFCCSLLLVVGAVQVDGGVGMPRATGRGVECSPSRSQGAD